MARRAKALRRNALDRTTFADGRTWSRAQRGLLAAAVVIVGVPGTAVVLFRDASGPAGSQERLFQVRGAATGLAPDVSRPLDLAVANSFAYPVVVTGVTVAVRALNAPNATAVRPCTSHDFEVLPYQGDRPLWLDARTTATLAELGVSDAKQPAIKLRNRPVNQDGCKGADVQLGYRLTATKATPDAPGVPSRTVAPRSVRGLPRSLVSDGLPRSVPRFRSQALQRRR